MRDIGNIGNEPAFTALLLYLPSFPAIPAENSLLREDNLQHGICELMTATNRVVLLYTIYAMRAIKLRK